VSDTTASLRRKIAMAADLQSVVRTMKAVAASSIGQYESSVRALADYYRTVQLGLSVALRDNGHAPPTALQKKTRYVGIVVFGSDQGLAGQFNETAVEYARSVITPMSEIPHVWAVGERLGARLRDAGLAIAGRFAVPNSVEAISPLVTQILTSTEAPQGEVDEIAELHLVFNRRAQGSAYAPTRQRLLPLDEDWRSTLSTVRWPTQSLPEVIGSRTTAVRALIREYVFVSLFRACAESLASENASRLAAMERAEKNIDELLENLNGTFHRLRQRNIDEELFDVISGYEALAKGAGA
jgi:F-type H+-transporting ATPase subunit gamma